MIKVSKFKTGMINVRKGILASMIAGMCFLSSLTVYADTRIMVNLPANLGWTNIAYGNRSLNYSYILLRNYSVYPYDGGSTNIDYVRCRVKDVHGNVISKGDYVSVSKLSDSAKQIPLKDGYLSTRTIEVQLSNSVSIKGRADVSYNLK